MLLIVIIAGHSYFLYSSSAHKNYCYNDLILKQKWFNTQTSCLKMQIPNKIIKPNFSISWWVDILIKAIKYTFLEK